MALFKLHSDQVIDRSTPFRQNHTQEQAFPCHATLSVSLLSERNPVYSSLPHNICMFVFGRGDGGVGGITSNTKCLILRIVFYSRSHVRQCYLEY